MSNEDKSETVYFGFRKIEKNQKTLMVANIFHSVAKKYDLMNDLMSFGLHRIWKRISIQYSGIYHGQYILDLAGGTGDLTAKLSRLVGNEGKIILADINDSMLRVGREKLRNNGILGNVGYIQTNAELLPFQDNTFNCIFISFGLRNITEREQALHSMYRVLKPGGRLLILEFFMPSFKLLTKMYNLYSFYVIPRIGGIVACDTDSYRYLVESIRMFPDKEKIKLMMTESGFCKVEYFDMTGGIVALHRGYKF